MPCFHVTLGDWLDTVGAKLDAVPDFTCPPWKDLFGEPVHQHLSNEDDQVEGDQSCAGTPATLEQQDQVSKAMDQARPVVPTQLPTPVSKPSSPANQPSSATVAPLNLPVSVPLSVSSIDDGVDGAAQEAH